MSEAKRAAEFVVVVGRPRAGKTTWIKERLLRAQQRRVQAGHRFRACVLPANRDDSAWAGYKELTGRLEMGKDPNHPKRSIPVWRFNERLDYDGVRVLHVDGSKVKAPALLDRYTGIRDAMLVIDDFKNVEPSKGDLSEYVLAWLSSRRHRMHDVFIACHAWSDINVDLWAKGPRLIIFPTSVGLTDAVLMKAGGNAERLIRIVEEVNREHANRAPGTWVRPRMIDLDA